MQKKKIISITLAVLLVGGVLLAYNWVGQVSAYSGTTPNMDAFSKDGPGELGEDLAAALGISLEELNSAQEEAFLSAIDAALKAEYITASQAETLKTGTGSFRALYRYLNETERAEFEQDVYLAEALGISESELEAAYDAIKQAKINQLVADGVITQDQADLQVAFLALRESSTFAENAKQAMTNAINAEVEAGTLTQAQADLLIEKLDLMPFGFGFSMPGMHGFEGLFGRIELRRPGGRR